MPMSNNNEQVFISRTDSGFPAYLDFTQLRTNAINYLGPITASYWTDYNIHDPGITTLEALLYALMDLGYRVNFPIADLLTPPPGDQTKDLDFFTPAQLLGGNPFTIIDYRKKLMDLPEVRNVWLEAEVGVAGAAEAGGAATGAGVRGIYAVYLELEMDPTDFATEREWEAYREKVVRQVKGVLQGHRNLCEDFSEPKILRKKPVTVSADIELSDGASPAQVYQDLIRALYHFFSPAPPYYTLGQLVQMGVSLDVVFEGRPYDKWPSHGFILDSDLPDRPTGLTPIYLSAVYHQLLQVAGIRTVRKLSLDTGDAGVTATDMSAAGVPPVWVSMLPDDSLAVLSITGSSFRWYRGGQLLALDLSAYNKALQQEVTHGGKVLYPAGSADLDGVIPQGVYLQGLKDYYSIQNDYPQVYGIGPGGLPATASVERQSQALQFKGFLLFFDQLLADYLAQLGNLRSLFSMGVTAGSSAANDDGDPEDTIGLGPDIDPQGAGGSPAAGGSTYFAGDVSSVPGLTPLLRFPGATGAVTMLVYPVDAGAWNAIASTGSVTCTQLGQLSTYTFADAADRDMAVALMALSFSVISPAVQYISVDGMQVVYAIPGMGKEFVLLSQSLFPDIAGASKEVAAVLYIGGARENYNLSTLTGKDGAPVYSFSLVQTGASYVNYVQALLEDPAQYTQRRTAFLQHLMDRFAESFTDYALLSAGFLSAQEIAGNQSGLMEKFLGNFPELSGNRARAYNYTKPGWNNTNISGLEKRFKAYSGIADWRRHWLCPFEVDVEDKKCQVAVTLAGRDLLVCPNPIPEKEAPAAAAGLFRNMGDAGNYQLLYRKESKRWTIGISFYSGYQAVSATDFPDEVQAATAAAHLSKMRQLRPGEEDIRVSRFEYRAEVLDAGGRVVRLSVTPFSEEIAAWEDATKRVHRIDDPKSWQFDAATDGDIGKLIRSHDESAVGVYMDVRDLSIAIKHDIPHKPDHCRFTVADKENTFRFSSVEHFATDTQGRAVAHELMFYLTDESNYLAYRDPYTERYWLTIQSEGRSLAMSEEEFANEEEASARVSVITRLLRQRLYLLRTARVPLDWKFDFHLGMPGSRLFSFYSGKAYPTVEAARAAAEDFYRADKGWEVKKTRNLFTVGKVGGKEVCVLEEEGPAPTEENVEAQLQQLVQLKNSMRRMQAGDAEALGSLVRPDAASKPGGYVYRLTDKNRPRAFHPSRWKTREEALSEREKLIAQGRQGYRYPEFCLGGDNIYFKQTTHGDGADRGGGTGGVWRFRIRCRNDYFTRIGLPGREEEWTLFESIAGYASADAAQQAFQDNYLLILGKAMHRVNYGEKDFISWDEEGRRKAVVFVPEDLQEAMKQAGLNTAEELVKAARAYPIRKEEEGEDRSRKKKDRFVFVLVNETTGETDWRSAGSFADAQQAHVAFEYFRLLLNISGNYFIDYDEKDCGFRLGLREVLAESATTFATAEAAWGPEGVEKFICVAQSAGGFHPEKRKDGSWGYFVACADPHALHPCRYETEQQRDTALQHLYTAAQGFPAESWFSGTDRVSLLDVRTGKTVARFNSGSKGEVDETFLNLVLDMAAAVWAGQFFEDDEGSYVPAGGGKVKIRPVDKEVGRDKWEDELLHYVAYFPVVRKDTKGAGLVSYLLEMKLPGFAALPGPWYVDKDCGCSPEKSGREPACFAAWVGAVAYTKATDAWKAYLSLLPLLDELSYYRPVHGEGPGEYGIGLYRPEDIVAFSQQTYAYAKMAARAMDRAGDCINMEGINLVEHLLLRPEKGATKEIPVCATGGNAGLPFQPGADPYSFIITAFLPAWPQRFRKKENRLLLEALLQQETPAHILLRILWLTPADMCRWESMYKDWLRWLTPEKPCGDFKPGDWVKLLFEEAPECLADCGDCGAVSGNDSGKTKDNDEWLSEINLLYCWKDRVCADTSGWKFDLPATGPKGGGIQFKVVPKPAATIADRSAPPVGAVLRDAGAKGKADKLKIAADKVKTAADKMQDASGKLQEVEKIVQEVTPVVTAAGLWSRILHRGYDAMESLLDRLKRLIEQQRKK